MERWQHRERKLRKRRFGMRVTGRSIKSVLVPTISKKAKEAKRDNGSSSSSHRRNA